MPMMPMMSAPAEVPINLGHTALDAQKRIKQLLILMVSGGRRARGATQLRLNVCMRRVDDCAHLIVLARCASSALLWSTSRRRMSRV
jgi:hypothetical protein